MSEEQEDPKMQELMDILHDFKTHHFGGHTCIVEDDFEELADRIKDELMD